MCLQMYAPELWLRKISPKTVFVSTNVPDKRVHVTKTQSGLDDLDDDSTDIYKSNIIEQYSLRPISIPTVNKLCLAQFAAFYYKDYKTEYDETKDSQPIILYDALLESHNSIAYTEQSLPSKRKLMNKNEYMKCRKVKAVMRYHTPNKVKQPELYFHHLLRLYLPWGNENELIGSDQTYANKSYQPNIQVIIQQNRAIFEPDADAITEALVAMKNSRGSTVKSFDALNDQENSDIQDTVANISDPK